MRRTFLSSLIFAGASLASAPSFASAKPRNVDKRLLGTWRSDKERMAQFWRHDKALDDATRRKFEDTFGKLQWRITETHFHGEFEGQKFSHAYSAVASDEKSAVIAFQDHGKTELKQYFFEEDSLHAISGHNIEFFKRVAT